MFRRISVLLALQFTAFVAILLIVNGILFIAGDYSVSKRVTDERLLLTSNRIITRYQSSPTQMSVNLLPFERDTVRIVDRHGNLIYGGNLFDEIPFDPRVGEFSEIFIGDEHVRILTIPILRLGNLEGFLQVGRFVESPSAGIARRAMLLLLTTLCISVITFFIGLYFAKRSLRPAEEAMTRLEQFTQDASHEIRTPLAVLGSSLDLALKTRDYRAGILSAKEDLRRITSLAERLLDLARLDKLALKPERTDVSALTAHVAGTFADTAKKKHITLETAIAEGVTVSADATLLRQLIENLLGNALKFTPEGGRVGIALKPGALRIADTGPGIPREDLPRIFDRFYQSDTAKTAGGFGLGLALVKRIADLHGWTIKARSKQGTEFTVMFQ
jgi:signal transduction histidine kinase